MTSFAVVVFCWVPLSLQGVYGGLNIDSYGPFDVLIRDISDCSEENEPALLKFYTKLQRVNRTTVLMSGRAELNISGSDDLKLKFSVDRHTPQGWKENFFYSEFVGKGVCSVLMEFGEQDAKRILAAMGAIDGNCPVPPGSYEIKPFALSWKEVVGIPAFSYGKYKGFFRIHYPDLSSPQVGCLVALYDVVPKRKKSG